MRKVEGLSLKYIGYQEPQTEDELELEILGLETAISSALQRIAVLKQSLKLQKIMTKSVVEDEANEKNIKKTTIQKDK